MIWQADGVTTLEHQDPNWQEPELTPAEHGLDELGLLPIALEPMLEWHPIQRLRRFLGGTDA